MLATAECAVPATAGGGSGCAAAVASADTAVDSAAATNSKSSVAVVSADADAATVSVAAATTATATASAVAPAVGHGEVIFSAASAAPLPPRGLSRSTELTSGTEPPWSPSRQIFSSENPPQVKPSRRSIAPLSPVSSFSENSPHIKPSGRSAIAPPPVTLPPALPRRLPPPPSL